MVWIVEGEEEARYGNVRQDEDGDGETKGRRREGIKAKPGTLTNHPLTQRNTRLNPGTPQTY